MSAPNATPATATTAPADRLDVQLLPEGQGLHWRMDGPDRPHLIAPVTEFLDRHRLYVAAMSFNLDIASPGTSGANPYTLRVLAKGSIDDLKAVYTTIGAEDFPADRLPAPAAEPTISWDRCGMIHLSLYTPDRPGLTARLSEIVGRRREEGFGSFVHVLATTHNDGGPHGGTPYFRLVANVALPNPASARSIQQDLRQWAKDEDIEDDLSILPLTADPANSRTGGRGPDIC